MMLVSCNFVVLGKHQCKSCTGYMGGDQVSPLVRCKHYSKCDIWHFIIKELVKYVNIFTCLLPIYAVSTYLPTNVAKGLPHHWT